MTDVNIQPVSSQQASRMDAGPQQEPKMGDTAIDMSQFTRPSTSHSQLRAQLPAAPYVNREPAGAAQQHLFPVHTYVVPTNQPKQRGNYQKAAQFAMRNSRPPQPFFIHASSRGRPESIPDEGPTVKQHLQQQQKQMKEKERMVAEQRMFTDINGGSQINTLQEGIIKNEQSSVVKTFTVLQGTPVSSAPIGIAAGRSTTSVVQPKRSRATNVEGTAPPRNRKKNPGAGNRQVKVIVSPGITTSFSSNSAKQQLATAPYLVETQPLPPTIPVSSSHSSVNHASVVGTSNSEDALSKVSFTNRRNIASELTPLGFNSVSVSNVPVSNDSSAQVVDLSSQPSNGLDLVGADPFLNTNGLDDLDINDIVPFNVGDVNWTFQFDENQLFTSVGGGVQNSAAGSSQISSVPRPLDQSQFTKGFTTPCLPDNNYIRMEALDITSGSSITDDALPEDFLAPQSATKTDIIENLLKDDIIDNDPLLAQVDEKTLLNDSILNDFPEMLGGDAALRCVMNEGNDEGDDDQEMISLIDWVTNDDHKIGEDGEDFVQNLRDERLENSASEFYNVCGAVEFNNISGFDSEAAAIESMPSTSKKSALIATVPVVRPASLISQAHIAPNSSPTESSSKTPENTPTRQRRKQRSPKESDKERTPRVDRRRHEDRLAKQKKAEQDAIEKEKEARQQAADRERILQIMEMQQKEIEAETRAAEAQQKNGGTPGRNRNRNRSQARNRQTQRTSVSDPPSAPLTQRLSPIQPTATPTVCQPAVSSAVSQILSSTDHSIPPSAAAAQPGHPSIHPIAVDANLPASSMIQQPSLYQPTTSFTTATSASVQIESVPMVSAPPKLARAQTAKSFIVTEFSPRPPRPFSEDSGQKFYENQQPGSSTELRRTTSWDGNSCNEKQPSVPEEIKSDDVRTHISTDLSHFPVQETLPVIFESPQIQQQFTSSSGPHSQILTTELWTPVEVNSPVEEETPEETLETLKELQAFTDLQAAVLSGSEDQMKEALEKMDEEEQLNEYSELSTEALFSMLDNPQDAFTKEELQMFKENFGIDTDEQVQPEDLANLDIWEIKEEVTEAKCQSEQDVIRTQILVSLLLNTNDEKEEELAYMESQVAELERMSEEMYGIKLKALKNGMTSVTYANAALVDELSRLSGRLIVTNEERKLLARRLCHHQRNYIRRLQTASKRKSEAEKKKQELLRSPVGVLPIEVPKKLSKETKIVQDRNKNNKKKPNDDATKRVIVAGEELKPKAPPKRKRPVVKERLEKTPRRSSLDGLSTPSRKRVRAMSDVAAPINVMDVLPNSIVEQFPPLTVDLALPLSAEKTPVETVLTSPVPADPVVALVTQMVQKDASQPVSAINLVSNGILYHEAVVPSPSTPTSSVDASTTANRRKSSRRTTQTLNFTEVSPRGTPDPEESASLKRRRGRQTKNQESDTLVETPTRRRLRKGDDSVSKMQDSDEVAAPLKVNDEPTVDFTVEPAVDANVEETIVAVAEGPKEQTPSLDQELSAPHTPTNQSSTDVSIGVATPAVESPLNSVGGSEPQDTTTSPDTPASTESEEKGGRRMRPRRQSQLRHASEMIDILNDEDDDDDEPVKKRRRPRNANDTPKRQSTRTRRS